MKVGEEVMQEVEVPGEKKSAEVPELRRQAREAFGPANWISIARKDELLKALEDGLVPARFNTPAAPTDLAAGLAALIAQNMPKTTGGVTQDQVENLIAAASDATLNIAKRKISEVETEVVGKLDGLFEKMRGGVGTMAEQTKGYIDKQIGQTKNSIELLAERMQKGGGSELNERVLQLEKRMPDATGHIEKAITEAIEKGTGKMAEALGSIADARIETQLDKLADGITVKVQKKLAKEIVIKKGEVKIGVGKQHKTFPLLLTLLDNGIHAYMVGPAGSGKTMAAHSAAKCISRQDGGVGIDYYPQSVGAQTSLAQIIGYMDATGKYVRSVFREAYEKGGLYLLDEIDAGNANVLTAINSALANDHMSFPDAVITVHPDFRCVAAGNTWGQGADRQYVGRNQMDAATVDRFAQVVWDYDEELELAISGDPEWAKRVQNIRASVFKLNARIVVSPRASIKGAKLLAAGMNRNIVEDMLIWRGTDKATREKVMAGVPKDGIKVTME